MVVYIIPGKTQTAQEALNYVFNERKTAKNFNEVVSEYNISPAMDDNISLEDFSRSTSDGINRALNYAANKDKIQGYISGYLCNPESCDEDFKITKIKNLKRIGKRLKDETGNYFYHIIQSFPKELDISDEEVHRCGVELVERLGLYQAVICSHIHPAIDEKGEARGQCKHNHIIMNSHIYFEFVDDDNPQKMKYHNCKQTYAELQLINDQIAIEHGLPVIEKANKYRNRSWYEATEQNDTELWKGRIRADISNAMKSSQDFSFFEQSMIAAGYKLRSGNSKDHGQYVTYTCPDGKKVRDFKLGTGYTRSALESYWRLKSTVNHEVKKNKCTSENRIMQILQSTSEPLFVKFKKELSEGRKKNQRDQNFNVRNTYTNYMPLISPSTTSNAELSYFDADKTYEIVNTQHRKLTAVSGQDILEYYELRREQEKLRKEEEEQRRKEAQYKEYYMNSSFLNSATGDPYYIGRYDENGRERSIAELILILATVIIQNEFGIWEPPYGSELDGQEYRNDPIYAKKDWKVQRMLDTITLAREENISHAHEVDERCDQVGKEIAKTNAEIRRLTGSIIRMEPLIEAIRGYQTVKELCEKIYTMPDSYEKWELQKAHAGEIEAYKEHKSTMYRFKVISEDAIQDALERHEEYINKHKSAVEQNEKFRNQYTRLSKLKYNMQLAQNAQFCYGPTFRETLMDTAEETLEEKIKSAGRSKKHITRIDKDDLLER